MTSLALFMVAFACIFLWVLISLANDRITELEKTVKRLESAAHPASSPSQSSSATTREAARIAAEKAERKREIKRRVRVTKEERSGAQLDRTRELVEESQKSERARRDQIAKEYGWPLHPNDMELEPSERAAVLEAWKQRKPPPTSQI